MVVQVLVAKKRSELETRLVLKTVEDGAPSTGADLERSLGDMNRESAERAKSHRPAHRPHRLSATLSETPRPRREPVRRAGRRTGCI